MASFRWIQLTLLQITILQFTAGHSSYFTLKAGDGLILPCENVIEGQSRCERAQWIFSGQGVVDEVLFESGHFTQAAKRKGERISVKADCSLNIKKITVEEAGHFSCRYTSLDRQYEEIDYYLSVISIAERRENNKITLNCIVTGYSFCRHTVEWFYHGEEDTSIYMQTPQLCFGSVTFPASRLDQNSKYSDLFRCKVREEDTGNVHFPTLGPEPSDEITGWPWWYIPIALAVCLVTALAVIIWKKITGQRGQMEEGTVYPYASISFTRKPKKRERISNAVTYSCVKVCASGASTDANNTYSTIR